MDNNLELSSFLKAVTSLDNLIKKTEDKKFMSTLDTVVVNGLKAGVIQNFEFTYEISWKYMKRWLEHNIGSVEVDGVSRRQLYRLAGESHLIDSINDWMDFHIARNRTSHTYNLDTAEDVYRIALEFLPECKKFYSRLENKND